MSSRRAKDEFFESFWELATWLLEIGGVIGFILLITWMAR